MALCRTLLRRVGDYSYIGEYFRVLSGLWLETLGGAGILAVLLLLLTSFFSPPKWVLALIFVFAVFVAGYHAWRVAHVHTLPGLRIKEAVSESTRTDDLGKMVRVIQIVPECLTDGNVDGCRGFLLGVHRWSSRPARWEPTGLNEPLELEWSMVNTTEIALYPGVHQRLNVCYSNNRDRDVLPITPNLPFRFQEVLNISDRFRLAIRITARGCKAVDTVLELTFDGHWDRPRYTLL